METFFFACHPCGNKDEITVVDLAYQMSYKKHEWDCVNDKELHDAEDACKYARALAEKYGLKYIPFDSRYGDDYEDDVDGDMPTGMYLTDEEEELLGL